MRDIDRAPEVELFQGWHGYLWVAAQIGMQPTRARFLRPEPYEVLPICRHRYGTLRCLAKAYLSCHRSPRNIAGATLAPKFFIGIGAQRCGTTWLWEYLRGLPDMAISPIKEISYFDSKFVPGREGALRNPIFTRLALRGLARRSLENPWLGSALAWHYLGIRRLNDKSYRAYFDRLARSGRVAGEISPSYTALGPDAVAQIDHIMNEPNFFFVMRNPVDRLVSEFSFRENRPRIKGAPEGATVEDRLRALAHQSQFSDYANVLTTFGKGVPPERFHVMFTEDLFDPAHRQRVCDDLCTFLGVAPGMVADLGEVNRAPNVTFDAALRDELANILGDQYRAVVASVSAPLPPAWISDLGRLA